jgi:hypothetical protein
MNQHGELDWRDAAQAMIDGAAMLAPSQFGYWQDSAGQTVRFAKDAVAACAHGAMHYGLGAVRHREVSPNARGACADLESRYSERFASYGLLFDNDLHGRDFVLDRVKTLLNEASP